MILQSLVRYYEKLATQGKVETSGWNNVQVSARIVLDVDGKLKGLVSTKVTEMRGKRTIEVSASMSVPEQPTKSSGIKAYFLCDSVPYLFGINAKKTSQQDDTEEKKTKKETERAKECFAASRALHHRILDGCASPAAKAVLRFFDTWNPERAFENPIITENMADLEKASKLIFQVEHSDVHEDPEVREAWNRSWSASAQKGKRGQCLVTGEKNIPIAQLHPNIKGIRGAQTSGAALVSFNAQAYESFGHEGGQGYNAPVSKRAAFAYGAALNYLIRSGRSIYWGDSAVVYWSESGAGGYQSTFSYLVNGKGADGLTEAEVKNVINKILRGQPAELEGIRLSPNEPFYLLGLSPNGARLSVRFFYRNTFGKVVENINSHYERMRIVRPAWEKDSFIFIDRLLKSTVNPHSKDSAASPLMAGSLMRSIVSGYRYPESAYQNIILRVFSDQDETIDGKKQYRKVTYVKAAFIKAYLLKNCGNTWGGKITMAVNEKCSEIPYVLGRLFAVLEGLQQSANPEINATIKDRYFNSACATPSTVFPVLIKLSNAHLSKLETALRIYYSKKITALLEKIDVPDSGRAIPARLSLDEQGMFVLGYYQETQTRFTKKEDK